MIYKAYKDECYVFGISVNNDSTIPCRTTEFFDGYLDLSPKERKEFLAVEKKYYEWQELLEKRYKKA